MLTQERGANNARKTLTNLTVYRTNTDAGGDRLSRSVKRQNGTQSKFKEVLQNLRTGDPTHDYASFLMKLHLANLTQAETEEMEKDKAAMHMFATKAPRDEHNVRKLSENASDRNPAALVKASWKTSRRANLQSIAQHFDNPPDAATLMCRRSVVRITGENFEPDFGLCSTTPSEL